VAAKAVKEVAYHRDHAREWTLRLGDGTQESHRRMQDGIDWMWPLAGELFECDELNERLVRRGIAVDARALRPAWEHVVTDVLEEATLAVPETDWAPSGGRYGRHGEALGHMLAVMQSTHRAHPGATW